MHQGPTINIQKDALPPGLDLADQADVRRWLMGLVEVEVANSGRADPWIRILCDDKLVSAPLAGLFDVGREHEAAAHWHALGCMDGARRRFRTGSVLLGPEGAARTAAVAMEWEHDFDGTLEVGDPLPQGLPGFGARWWLGYRFYGQGGGGTGVLHGEWIEREGSGFEGLDEPFRELLDAGDVTVSLPPMAWQPTPGPEMVTEWVMRVPGGRKPTTATEFLEDVVSLAQPEALAKGIDRLWVFAFHDVAVEWTRVGGRLPCGLDDLLRNLAVFTKAEAIGVVMASNAQVPDGATKRTLLSVVEYEGIRAQRALVLDFVDGKAVPIGEMTHDPIDVPSVHRWIGVVPGHDMQIEAGVVVQLGKDGLGRPVPEG